MNMKNIKKFIIFSLTIILLMSSLGYLSSCKKNKKFTVTFTLDNQVVQTQTVKNGQLATKVEAPTKENHEFLGWYNGEILFDFNTPITQNYSLVGKYQEKEITPDGPILATRIEITTSEVSNSVIVGDSIQIYAKVYPENASQELNWSFKCFSGAKAELNENHLLTTSEVGTVYVYVDTLDGSGVSKSIKIDILHPLLEEEKYEVFNVMGSFGSNASTDIEINYHTFNILTSVEYTVSSDTEFKNKTVVKPTSGYYFTSEGIDVEYPYTPRNVMRASITGLQPNTEYIYRINQGNDTYTDVYTIKTSKNDGSKITFLAMADIHYWYTLNDITGKCESHGSEISENVIAQARTKYPDIGFLATAGDIIDQGGNIYAWQMFFEHSTSLKEMARIGVAGNHEYYYRSVGQTDYKFQKAHYATPYNGPSTHIGASGYTLYNDLLFITFDNEQSTGKATQLAWLEHVLQTVEAKYTVIMMHTPIFYPSNSSNPYDRDEELMGVLEKYSVDLAISGHYHSDDWEPNYYEGVTSTDEGLGVNYLSLSFGGTKSLSETNRPTGYVIEVENGVFKITRINDRGETKSVRTFETKKHKEVVPETKENLINSVQFNYNKSDSSFTVSFSNKFYGNVKELSIKEVLRGEIEKSMVFPTPSYTKLTLKALEKYYDYQFVITITFNDGSTHVINYELKLSLDISPYIYTDGNLFCFEIGCSDESMDLLIKQYIVYANGKEVARIPYLTNNVPTEYFEINGLDVNQTYEFKLVAVNSRQEIIYTVNATN